MFQIFKRKNPFKNMTEQQIIQIEKRFNTAKERIDKLEKDKAIAEERKKTIETDLQMAIEELNQAGFTSEADATKFIDDKSADLIDSVMEIEEELDKIDGAVEQ